jgi:RecJ-like exonuclease
MVNSLAQEFGGSGGGHDKACGAVIPKDKIMPFIKEFNTRLSQK